MSDASRVLLDENHLKKLEQKIADIGGEPDPVCNDCGVRICQCCDHCGKPFCNGHCLIRNMCSICGGDPATCGCCGKCGVRTCICCNHCGEPACFGNCQPLTCSICNAVLGTCNCREVCDLCDRPKWQCVPCNNCNKCTCSGICAVRPEWDHIVNRPERFPALEFPDITDLLGAKQAELDQLALDFADLLDRHNKLCNEFNVIRTGDYDPDDSRFKALAFLDQVNHDSIANQAIRNRHLSLEIVDLNNLTTSVRNELNAPRTPTPHNHPENVTREQMEQHFVTHRIFFTGPPGVPGERGADSTVPGPRGADGESIVGPPGQDGKDGRDGVDGQSIVGPPGERGSDGTPADMSIVNDLLGRMGAVEANMGSLATEASIQALRDAVNNSVSASQLQSALATERGIIETMIQTTINTELDRLLRDLMT